MAKSIYRTLYISGLVCTCYLLVRLGLCGLVFLVFKFGFWIVCFCRRRQLFVCMFCGFLFAFLNFECGPLFPQKRAPLAFLALHDRTMSDSKKGVQNGKDGYATLKSSWSFCYFPCSSKTNWQNANWTSAPFCRTFFVPVSHQYHILLLHNALGEWGSFHEYQTLHLFAPTWNAQNNSLRSG